MDSYVSCKRGERKFAKLMVSAAIASINSIVLPRSTEHSALSTFHFSAYNLYLTSDVHVSCVRIFVDAKSPVSAISIIGRIIFGSLQLKAVPAHATKQSPAMNAYPFVALRRKLVSRILVMHSLFQV